MSCVTLPDTDWMKEKLNFHSYWLKPRWEEIYFAPSGAIFSVPLFVVVSLVVASCVVVFLGLLLPPIGSLRTTFVAVWPFPYARTVLSCQPVSLFLCQWSYKAGWLLFCNSELYCCSVHDLLRKSGCDLGRKVLNLFAAQEWWNAFTSLSVSRFSRFPVGLATTIHTFWCCHARSLSTGT